MDLNLSIKKKYPLKFIDFKKPGTSIESNSNSSISDCIEVKEFYTELVSNDDKPIYDDNDQNEIQYICTKKAIPIISNDEYLKAAQYNKLTTVSQFIENNKDQINFKDSFGWNALMIAIASSKSNRIVEYLFTQVDNPLFEELLYSQDSAGNSALTIANKKSNKLAIDLIEKFNHVKDLSKKIKNIEEIDLVNDDIEQVKYCETCNIKYSNIQHLSSISHLLNSESTCSFKPSFSYNYHIQRENKGYQLLCKSGWTNNKKGLGKFEQGQLCPIKTRQKLNRYGIGATNDEQTVCKTKESNKFRLESQLNHFKNSSSKLRKEKQREHKLRSYFNS